MNIKRARILLVDDNPDDRVLAMRELRKELGKLIIEEIQSQAELNKALATPADIVITDFQLGWSNGLAVLREVRETQPACSVIMFTGSGSEEIAVQAMKNGLDDYVLKSGKHCGRLVSAVRAILEKMQTTLRADEVGQRFHTFLDRLNVGVFRTNGDGLLLDANRGFLKLMGWEEIPTETYLRELYFRPELHSEHTHRLRRAGDLHEYEVELCRAGGGSTLVSMSQTLSRGADGEEIIDGMIEDVSERAKLESQLRHAQRLESIGRLAAGVGHDFNNILTIIQGYAGLLTQKELEADTNLALKNIMSAADRAATLTRQLLAFSRKQVMHHHVLDLNAFLQNFYGLLRHFVGDKITVEMNCSPDLPDIRGDEAMLQQMLMNLAMNARDAMPNGGKLMIHTGMIQIDRDSVRVHSEARPGTFVYLAITDTGNGISAENLNQLFEPFFTTKETGKGTGLGLAAVYGIVKQHKGWTEVVSEVGSGASFRIFLPAEPKVIPMPAPEPIREGNETVLLVEDEVELLELVGEVLQANGYQVIPASCGKTALEVWQHSRQKIDLLITDMRMPDSTGLELAQTLTADKPWLKVLYTSGYSPDSLDPKANLREGINYLQKPYPPDRLLDAIRNVLEARCGSNMPKSEN